MSYTSGRFVPYAQYGSMMKQQFEITYTQSNPVSVSQCVSSYNPLTSPYHQNTIQHPNNAQYGQGGFNVQKHGTSYSQAGPYGQQPSATQGQYSNFIPPNSSNYKNRPFNQASSSRHQTPLPTYNQAPPPNLIKNVSTNYQERPAIPQIPAYLHPQQGIRYPQPHNSYAQTDSSFIPNKPSFLQGTETCTNNANSYPITGIGPQKPLKRPHMPPKLQTSFKHAKKSVAQPPQAITSMQPIQGGKSAVSSVNDIAYQSGWTVNWFEESETGPAHAKIFSVKATMGPYEVNGSGRSKKNAKQDAAQLLLAQVTGNEIADMIGLPPSFTAGQTGNTSEDYGPQLPKVSDEKTIPAGQSGGDNPISELDHVAKKHKLGEPQYITICENGPLALQRFDIKVKVNNMEASGLGRSKKVAKRNAAQAMLAQLSKAKVGIQPPKKRIMFVKASSETG